MDGDGSKAPAMGSDGSKALALDGDVVLDAPGSSTTATTSIGVTP